MIREILVCPPTSAGPSRVAESTPARCAECGQEVWVAPSGRALILRLELTILCRPCVERHQAEGESVERMPLQPEQIEERRRRGLR